MCFHGAQVYFIRIMECLQMIVNLWYVILILCNFCSTEVPQICVVFLAQSFQFLFELTWCVIYFIKRRFWLYGLMFVNSCWTLHTTKGDLGFPWALLHPTSNLFLYTARKSNCGWPETTRCDSAGRGEVFGWWWR